MPLKLWFLALAGAVVLTAATPLMWLDPIVTDREATFDPALLGVWGETGGHDLLIFRRNGPAVEIAIEAEDRSDTVALHDCDVDGIAG